MKKTFSYIQKIFSSFSRKEILLFLTAAIFFIASSVLLTVALVDEYTIQIPHTGGELREGIVGQISLINPILAQDNTPDGDITALVFANIPTIAERIKYSDDFKTWNVRIREDARWHNGTAITSDDIIFTIQTIKNPQAASPLFDIWKNISVQRISEREIEFHLLDSYALFENILRELRPIPKQLFADIAPANIKLSVYNLRPLGSGPYAYTELTKRDDGFISSYTLSAADTFTYTDTPPLIDTLTFMFFEHESQRIDAFNSGAIDSFGTFDPEVLETISINKNIYDIPTRRYYALFFNTTAYGTQISQSLRDDLIHSIDTQALITDIFNAHADPIRGPLDVVIPPTEQSPSAAIHFEESLAAAGWEQRDTTWGRMNGDMWEEFSPTITVPDTPLLTQLAHRIASQWKQYGINATVAVTDPQVLSEDILPSRDYEILLFGNILLKNPDPSSFWHSNEIFHPGQNFSLLQDDVLDTLLAELKRSYPDTQEYVDLLYGVNEQIQSHAPAAFLLSPHYLYITSSRIPSLRFPQKISFTHDRFEYITSWYIKTTRTFRSSKDNH